MQGPSAPLPAASFPPVVFGRGDVRSRLPGLHRFASPSVCFHCLAPAFSVRTLSKVWAKLSLCLPLPGLTQADGALTPIPLPAS